MSVAFVLMLLLTGCPVAPPDSLAFDTDPRILRGHYRGTIDARVWPDEGAMSPDGSMLAFRFSESEQLAELWRTDEMRFIGAVGERDEKTWGASGLALSGDGGLLAIVYRDRVQLWDTHELERLRVLAAPEVFGRCSDCGFRRVSLSPDGSLLAAVGSAPTVALFDAATGALVRAFPTPDLEDGDVAFSADGSRLAASLQRQGNGYGLRVWDVQLGTALYEHDYSLPNFRAPALAFSADGSRIVTLAEGRLWPTDGSTVQVVEISSGQSAFTLHTRDYIGGFALNPDGSQLAIVTSIISADGATGGTVVHDVVSGESLAEFADAYRASWSVDGRYLLAGSKLVDARSFTVLDDFVQGQLYRLELESVPEYVDAQRYNVAGKVRIDAAEAIAFKGSVDGNESQRYVRPQARVRNPASFVLELEDPPWLLYGYQRGRALDGTDPPDPSAWEGWVREGSDSSELTSWPLELSRVR